MRSMTNTAVTLVATVALSVGCEFNSDSDPLAEYRCEVSPRGAELYPGSRVGERYEGDSGCNPCDEQLSPREVNSDAAEQACTDALSRTTASSGP